MDDDDLDGYAPCSCHRCEHAKLMRQPGHVEALMRDISRMRRDVDLHAEEERAFAKFGAQLDLPDGTGRPGDDTWRDEVRADVETDFALGGGEWRGILEEEVAEAFAETDPALLRAELLQVAAVALRWVDAIDAR